MLGRAPTNDPPSNAKQMPLLPNEAIKTFNFWPFRIRNSSPASRSLSSLFTLTLVCNCVGTEDAYDTIDVPKLCRHSQCRRSLWCRNSSTSRSCSSSAFVLPLPCLRAYRLTEVDRDGQNFINRCTKPDRREFLKISQAIGVGFVIMGTIGFIVKLGTRFSLRLMSHPKPDS